MFQLTLRLSAILTLCGLVFILGAGAAGHFRTGEIIAFSGSDPNGLNYVLDIFVLDVHSGITHNLTHHPDGDFGFSWSPDGSQIVFISTREGGGNLYLIRCNRQTLSSLTSGFSISQTAWSPDGQSIAFLAADLTSGLRDIFTLSLHNGEAIPQNLTNTLVIDEVNIAWSPDSSRIAYIAEGSLFTVEVGTLNRQRLTPTSQESFPTWSPDGQYIAHYTWDGIIELFSLEDTLVLPETIRANVPITWSPDGKRLAIAANFRGQSAINLVNIDDFSTFSVPTSFYQIGNFSWSADGNQIAFSGTISYPDFQRHVYILEISTGKIRQVVYQPEFSNSPVWKP